MNISSRNNAMPVFLLRNCASHLSGSLRTIGAVAVGQLGMSLYCYLGRRVVAVIACAAWNSGAAGRTERAEELEQ